MQNEIRWLVRLGFDQGLFTREHAAAVRDALPADVGLMDFAQKLIDEGYVADSQLELLEQIAGLAFTKARRARRWTTLSPFSPPSRPSPPSPARPPA